MAYFKVIIGTKEMNNILNNYYIDLQLFASAEDEGRTEEPTERKRRKAREEGNVAKSQDLVSAFVFLFTFWTVWFLAKNIISEIKKYFISTFSSINANYSYNDVTTTIFNFSFFFWKIVGPAILIAVIIAFFVNSLQVGFMFAPKSIIPKFSKISFTFSKLKERVLMSKTVFTNFIFSVLKFLILSFIFVILIKSEMKEIMNLGFMGINPSVDFIGNLIIKLFNATGIILLVVAIPDYFVKKKQFEDSLKMTKEELKREFKEEEGDPLIKAEIRKMYVAILNRQNIRKRVPESDFVVTNPTHYAVAIKYDMVEMSAPVVTAKGEDNEALLIKDIAKEYGVPIIENPPLARQLYNSTEVGQEIPPEFYVVVAEILIQIGKFK